MIISLLIVTIGCQKADLTIPDNNITCYTATYSEGVFKSDNGGKSWYPIIKDQENIQLYFKRILMSPNNGLLYVGTTGAGLYTIDLNNKALAQVEALKDENVRAMAFYMPAGSQDSIQVLAGTLEHGVYFSLDNGNEWAPLNEGLTYRDVNTFLTGKNSELYAGTKKDLFQWNSASNSWTSVSAGIKNKNIISMACNPKDSTLYAGAGVYDGGKGLFERYFGRIPCLYKSTDKGKTWVKSERGIKENSLVYDIVVNRKNPDRIYTGTSDGIYLSKNSGKKWKKLDKGLPKELRVFDIEIVAVSDDRELVYAATSKGIFAAPDINGAPWTSMSYGLPATNITGLVLVP